MDLSGTVSVEGESEGDHGRRWGECSWRKEGELGRERGSGGWEMWAGARRQCPGSREAAAERGRPCAWWEGPGSPGHLRSKAGGLCLVPSVRAPLLPSEEVLVLLGS